MKCWFAIAFVALLSYPAISQADRASVAVEFGVEDARERFRKGVELYREGSYDASFAEFSKAYEIVPDYRVLYNLAQVQAERHEYAAALKLVDDYLKHGEGEIATERLEHVRTWLAQLKGRVAVLWVQCPLSAAELLVDGLPAAVLPQDTPLLLNSGVHQLQLRKAGYETVTRELTIAGGEKVLVELPAPLELGIASATVVSVETTPDDLSPPSDAPKVPPVATPTHSRTPLWISLISTAVVAGGAVTFGALASSLDSELDRELARLPADQARVNDLRSDLKRNAALSDVFTVGAVIGAGVSLYFALSGLGAEKLPRNRPEPALRLAGAGRVLSLAQDF
jgi:hypothetical protein